MSWEEVRLKDFLTNRENRFKPNAKEIQGLKRIDKIDFSGQIFISNKPSNTDMILVKSGDLVISGINVEKGAMAIYQGDEDITATIHYSSYEFDIKKIDIDFLKFFLKSPEFKGALKEQVPGGIKTEIKPKHLLPLKITIPTSLKEQRELVKKLDAQNLKLNILADEYLHQLQLLNKLRQQILQDAISGKLTENWRKENLNVESASRLLEKIKAEKEKLIKEKKIKKDKQLVPVKKEEIPFEIPDSWEWCRLEEISEIGTGATPLTTNKEYYEGGNIPWITSSATGNLFVNNIESFITEKALNETNCRLYPIGTLVVAMYGEGKTRGQITELNIEAATNQACATITPYLNKSYLRKYIKLFFQKIYNEIRELAQGGAQPNLNMGKIKNTLVPLPPLIEQQYIVQKLEQLLKYHHEIENNIKQNQVYTEKLLQVALKEALEPKEVGEMVGVRGIVNIPNLKQFIERAKLF